MNWGPASLEGERVVSDGPGVWNRGACFGEGVKSQKVDKCQVSGVRLYMSMVVLRRKEHEESGFGL